MKMSGTKILFFLCSHSLRHLTGSNGAIGRPFLSSQHILLGYLYFLQCRSRSLVPRDPAALYLHHLHRCSEEDTLLWIISVSSVIRTSCPSFKCLKAEIIHALSLLNRCSCRSGSTSQAQPVCPGDIPTPHKEGDCITFFLFLQALYTQTIHT